MGQNSKGNTERNDGIKMEEGEMQQRNKQQRISKKMNEREKRRKS